MDIGTTSFDLPITDTRTSKNGRRSAGGTLIDHSGTIVQANVSQLLLKETPRRRFFFIQNLDPVNPLWINFSLAAQASWPSILIGGGGVFKMGDITTEAVYILSPVAGVPFVAKEAVE